MTCNCIARNAMPQVNDQDLPELFVFLQARGITIRRGTINPRLVRGRQKVVRAKVRKINECMLASPVIISSDMKVIDGNHRWMKHYIKRSVEMAVVEIGVGFEEALRVIFEFPKTYISPSAGTAFR